jgi:hypothetical protein
MEFFEWFTDKFVMWRGRRYGQSASLAEFAKQFGASHQLVSEWMKKDGKVPTHAKYITALVKVYGAEVYDVLGLPHPEVRSSLDILPGEIRQAIEAAAVEIGAELAAQNVSAGTPEADEITTRILEKYGVKYIGKK